MLKRANRRIAIVLAVAMLLTCFAYAQPVDAASKPDMKKANVKWDLKNNKKLKYKQYWYSMGVKTHTVKMTKYKVKNSRKPGYKECTFTLTFNMKVKPKKWQVAEMGIRADSGYNYTNWGFCVVDYQTGMTLARDNDKDVKVTYKFKNSKYIKHKGTAGSWIRYPRESVVKVKIVYPKKYKGLTIGAVGLSNKNSSNADKHWNGKIPFSKATSLYSKKDKKFAHFMRVK